MINNRNIFSSESQVNKQFTFNDVQNTQKDRSRKLQLKNRPIFKSAPLKKIYIHQIRGGSKTIEGRINKGLFAKVKEGDHIRFYYYQNAKDDVVCQIIKKYSYVSFKEMLAHEKISACIPGITHKEKALELYHAIPGYQEKAARFGVVALHLLKI